MPRPVKRRMVCQEPRFKVFGPPNISNKNSVCMPVEEYEAIRLIDHEGLTQEECAKLMGVARTTVQKIYDDARFKIADALVKGFTLRIEGGNYNICSNMPIGRGCNHRRCKRFRGGR